MIVVSCSCGRRFKAEDHHAGKRTKCPVCGNLLMIGQPVSVGPSGVNDNGELPAWWFPPGVPISQVGANLTPPHTPPTTPVSTASGSNPDEIPTVEMARRLAPAPPTVQPGQFAAPGGLTPASPPTIPGIPSSGITAGAIGALLTLGAVALAAFIWYRSSERPGGGEPAVSVRNVQAPAVESGAAREAPPPSAHLSAPAENTTASPHAARTGVGDSPGSLLNAPVAKRVSPAPAPRRRSDRMGLLVPAYFYPAGVGAAFWRQLMEAAADVDVVAVANPSNGPGDVLNDDYARVIKEAASSGVKVVGYVSTDYARKSLIEVKNEIDRWLDLYPQVRGVFFDQQSPQAKDLEYYLSLRDYSREKLSNRQALVITNPGTPCAEDYFARSAADTICIFSNPEGFEELELGLLQDRYPPSCFAALAYNIPGAEAMQALVHAAWEKGIGLIYISDAQNPSNPWSRLPAYWEEEVQAVAQTR